MKFAKITLSVALLGALTLGMADETASASVSVDTQIAAIQAAPAQERVQLMNQFKQKLATMNQADRMAAIQEMQQKMQAQAATQMQAGQAMGANGQEMGSAMKQKATEHAQEMQMQTNEQMTQMQNMNQRQSGNQFMNMNGGSMSGAGGRATGRSQNMNFNMPAGR